MKSVAAYRGFLALLRPLRPTSDDGALGHEHYMLVDNVLNAAILRKYLSGDSVSLQKTAQAVERKLGRAFSEGHKRQLTERMHNLSNQHAAIVESYLYSEVLHAVPRQRLAFQEHTVEERKSLPAALVEWIADISSRVLLMEEVIDHIARDEKWSPEFHRSHPSDPAYVGRTIFDAAHDATSSDYRFAQEHIRERDERYFNALDSVQHQPSVLPRPKADKGDAKLILAHLYAPEGSPYSNA